jgi:hypothetical protein
LAGAAGFAILAGGMRLWPDAALFSPLPSFGAPERVE